MTDEEERRRINERTKQVKRTDPAFMEDALEYFREMERRLPANGRETVIQKAADFLYDNTKDRAPGVSKETFLQRVQEAVSLLETCTMIFGIVELIDNSGREPIAELDRFIAYSRGEHQRMAVRN